MSPCLSLGSLYHFDQEPAPPGPIELTKEEPLPGPQNQSATLYEYRLRGAYDAGLDVGVGVPLQMAV